MSETEKLAYEEKIKDYFETGTIIENGVEVTIYIIELRVGTADRTKYIRYGFKMTDSGLELVSVSTAEA